MPKVAIVTGAGSGIGRAVALALLGAGYEVALCRARRRGAGTDDLPGAGGCHRVSRSRPISAMNARSSSCFAPSPNASAASTCSSTMPASARPPSRMEDLTYEQWNAVVAVNLTGAFLCAQEAIPDDEGAGAARRPHHQQRLHLRARPAAELGALHRHQARHHRPHQIIRSTAAPTTSPAARSISATPPPR